MTTKIDACGLSCPQPVMLAVEAINKGEFPVELVVDTATSRDNVTRIARSFGVQVEVKENGELFTLTLTK